MLATAWKTVVKLALQEDIGCGDITSNAIFTGKETGCARIVTKADGVIAGMEIAAYVFTLLDQDISFTAALSDGARVRNGDCLAEISGRITAILAGERVALNFLQHLSGIATATAIFTEQVRELPVRVTDTRKTTPGLRALEKYAVRTGGGCNHRFNLSDGILIKDNHIKAAGSITAAIAKARQLAGHLRKIEVEVENLGQLQEALQARADIIMLDNMSIADMRQAVTITAGRALLEASGGITENNIAEIAATGVNIVSSGALTHSVKSLDICLDIL